MDALRYHWLAITWGILILILSFLPGKDLEQLNLTGLLAFDKWMHAFFYAPLFFLSLVGILKQYGCDNWRSNRNKVLFFCISYGLLIEIMQPLLTEDRYFDFFDIIANTVGCFFGIIIFNFVYNKILS